MTNKSWITVRTTEADHARRRNWELSPRYGDDLEGRYFLVQDHMKVLASTGLPDTIIVPTDVLTLLQLHRKVTDADPRGRGVAERKQGAFTSTHVFSGDEVCVREEFSFRGHVVYVMTAKERVSDDVAEWVEFEMQDT
jgi:hypothetical protein